MLSVLSGVWIPLPEKKKKKHGSENTGQLCLMP